ncbi:SGNH hydrolase-type esterase domain-containing protein [Paraphoma chrysanthemicola]|uniref:SGNH hydrolase-type esterase domain-containing protein n=1 Tax=Paraphoma chrysanthemicola TaxID=798071 RepID=A0A8K0W060_9PLEO|nr:SGNH hydrolase-type esterase domain-containing protein [Paraphoma chrysanthemicola]
MSSHTTIRPIFSTLLWLACSLSGVSSRPQALRPTFEHVQTRANSKFILGAIGDSWGSGVSWSEDTQYDDNMSRCMRYKYAWSTVVNSNYSQWTPDTGKESVFEFKACSGAHLEDMMNQMDQLTRPNLVLMEAGGNNADFYPMADACLFQANYTKDYGTKYEHDNDPKNRTGECRREIDLVRSRLQGDAMEQKVRDTIHAWRGHKAVVGNDASLFLLGYARFFGPDLDPACDKWNFCIPWKMKVQNLVAPMRADFNELVGSMNTAIRRAVESFDDDKIQFIDIDPGFEGHRFCEPGHRKREQYNWNDEVHIWNQPMKWTTTVINGDDVKTYDPLNGILPPPDIMDKLDDAVDGVPRQEGEYYILTWRNPKYLELSMEWKIRPRDFYAEGSDAGGSIARTLHPTETGHRDMGNIVIQHLQRHYGH